MEKKEKGKYVIESEGGREGACAMLYLGTTKYCHLFSLFSAGKCVWGEGKEKETFFVKLAHVQVISGRHPLGAQ